MGGGGEKLQEKIADATKEEKCGQQCGQQGKRNKGVRRILTFL